MMAVEEKKRWAQGGRYMIKYVRPSLSWYDVVWCEGKRGEVKSWCVYKGRARGLGSNYIHACLVPGEEGSRLSRWHIYQRSEGGSNSGRESAAITG
jgi:hypothetical protein